MSICILWEISVQINATALPEVPEKENSPASTLLAPSEGTAVGGGTLRTHQKPQWWARRSALTTSTLFTHHSGSENYQSGPTPALGTPRALRHLFSTSTHSGERRRTH